MLSIVINMKARNKIFAVNFLIITFPCLGSVTSGLHISGSKYRTEIENRKTTQVLSLGLGRRNKNPQCEQS